MRKSYFLLIPLLIWGCEKAYDNLIDTSTENFQVSNVIFIDHSPPVVYDLKTPADSLLKLRINFTEESVVNKTFFDVYASDNSRLNSSPIEMQKVTENIFENQFILKREYPIGNYTVRFSASGLDGKNKQVAVASFYFNNGQDNLPPEISNLVIPDTISKGAFFNFSIMVSDSNGLNDIRKEDGVFFNLFRPDTSIVQAGPFYMHDDGDAVFGDEIAGDGIFSFRNLFLQDTTTQVGNWRFVFQARDLSGLGSNIIEHYLYVNEN